MRKSLDLGGLADFTPRRVGQGVGSSPVPAETVSEPRWQSREPVREGQINVRADVDTLERFKALCRSDRRTYGAMLNILMDAFERGPTSFKDS